MTLIASTINNDRKSGLIYPMIIGDVLFTSEDGQDDMILPTFLGGIKGLLPQHEVCYPVFLEQKIYVIANNLAIGMAGSKYEMKLFLEDIKSFFKHKKVALENIEDFMSSYSFNSNFSQSALLILFLSDDKRVLTIKHGVVKEVVSEAFGKILALGSGADVFIDKACSMSNTNRPQTGLPNLDAIMMNISLLGRLLTLEKTHLTTLHSYWGCAFEIIAVINDKFQKINDITYIILSGPLDLDTGARNIRPNFMFNNLYYDDLLFITSYEFESKRSGGFIVPPIDKKKSDVDLNSYNFSFHLNSSKICLTYIFSLSDGSRYNVTSYFDKSVLESTAIIINEELSPEFAITLQINSEIEDFICSKAIVDNKSGKTIDK